MRSVLACHASAGVLLPKPSRVDILSDATTLAAKLRERGVIVRHFKMARIDQFLRISVGTDVQCGALMAALREILA